MVLQTLPDEVCYHKHMSRMKMSHHMRMRKELDNMTIKVHGGKHCFYMGGNQQSHCSAAPPPALLPPYDSATSSWHCCFLASSAASLAPLVFSVSSATIYSVHYSSACFALLHLLHSPPSGLLLH